MLQTELNISLDWYNYFKFQLPAASINVKNRSLRLGPVILNTISSVW